MSQILIFSCTISIQHPGLQLEVAFMISRSLLRHILVGTSQGKPPLSSPFADASARTAQRNGKASIVLKPRRGQNCECLESFARTNHQVTSGFFLMQKPEWQGFERKLLHHSQAQLVEYFIGRLEGATDTDSPAAQRQKSVGAGRVLVRMQRPQILGITWWRRSPCFCDCAI